VIFRYSCLFYLLCALFLVVRLRACDRSVFLHIGSSKDGSTKAGRRRDDAT
jgi:hypothetical protein